MDKEKILSELGINETEFNDYQLEWSKLIDIFKDFTSEKNLSNCEIKVEEMSRIFRKYRGVHSVTYRVKSGHSLIKKVIKKRINYPERIINKDNYRVEITDLLGIRLLHLFKDDWEAIHNQIIDEGWKLVEIPIIYKREGDYDICEKRGKNEFQKKIHGNGYRSIHYIIEEKIANKTYIIELQTRTIFEEAWSQIDHLYKYKTNSIEKSNHISNSLLLTLNRIIGSADELGTLIKKIKPAEDTAYSHIQEVGSLSDEKILQLIKLRRSEDEKFEQEFQNAKKNHDEHHEIFEQELIRLKKETEEELIKVINNKLSNESKENNRRNSKKNKGRN